MGIFGWSYPPGVSERDLPGNSDAEQAAEAFGEAMYDQMPESMGDDLREKLLTWAWAQVGDAYAKGYQQGQADAHLAYEESQPPIETV